MRVRYHGEAVQICAERGSLVLVMWSDGMTQWVNESEVQR